MSGRELEVIDILGTIFFILCVISFLIVFYLQYLYINKATERLVILITRTALYLPIFALLFYIALLFPKIEVIISIPIAVTEGYVFYCFFALLVTNLGGPEDSVAKLDDAGEFTRCVCFCDDDKRQFYHRTMSWLFHFLFTRSILRGIISVLNSLASKRPIGRLLIAVCALGSFAITLISIVYIIIFCKLENFSEMILILLIYFIIFFR